MSGAVSHRAGMAAETAVAAVYARSGLDLVASRWRGTGGEIDLILRDGAVMVFVEVKKSRDFARALMRVTPAKVARIFAAAGEFLANEPMGLNTETRFDVALVEASGRVQVIENALGP